MKRFAIFVELEEKEYRAVHLAAALRGQTMKAFTWDALRNAMGNVASEKSHTISEDRLDHKLENLARGELRTKLDILNLGQSKPRVRRKRKQ